jgi:PAS domain S-box-containing protein
VTEAVPDLMPAPEWVPRMNSRAGRRWAAGALFVGYLAVYLIVDRLSFIEAQHGIGITPWSPTAGLALALLIIKGLRWAPAVLAAELLSSATLPQITVPPAAIFAATVIVTCGYMGAAAILRRIGFEPALRRTSDVVLLLLVTILSSGLVAGGFVAIYAAAGVVPWSSFPDAVFHFWVGDAIGIVVFAPPLLILNRPLEQFGPADREGRRLQLLEIGGQGASIVAALALVFSRIGGDSPFGLFYVLFLPLIWIATRGGLVLASWALLAIQFGLIAGLRLEDQWGATLRAFQLLMLALAMTGLMLGAVVSERHRLMRVLAESESRRRTVLNTARDGVLTIDARGRIQSINRAVGQLFGLPDGLLIGHDVHEIVDGAPDLLARMSRMTCPQASETTTWELDARRADGLVFPIELSIGRCDPPGPEQYTLVIRDISLRRKAETRACEHQAELAHVSRVSLAGEMAAALAHELSQPLTAIAAYGRGCLRLLAGPAPAAASLREGVSEVVQQAERAGDILSRLREFVSGGVYRRALVEVPPLINAALGLARVEATQSGVEIEARIDPGLPPVFADHIQIEQVLLNLLKNAIDAIVTADSHERSILLVARRKSVGAVEISVADSGPGIADEAIGRLFEPFVTTKPNGMGMGLTISRSIIEWHGGALRMAHNKRSGVVFAFDLPTGGPR